MNSRAMNPAAAIPAQADSSAHGHSSQDGRKASAQVITTVTNPPPAAM